MLLRARKLFGLRVLLPFFTQGAERHRFATSYIGPEAGLWTSAPGLATAFTPGLKLGAYHFWGRADFYLSFPLAAIPFGTIAGSDLPESAFHPGISTGARYFLWKKGPRPYFGAIWRVMDYRAGEGPYLSLHRLMPEAGLDGRLGRGWRWEIGAAYTPNVAIAYPISRNLMGKAALPRFSFSASLKRTLDFTSSYGAPSNQPFLHGLAEAYRTGRALNGLTLAAGISTAFPIGPNRHNEKVRPFLGGNLPPAALPDLALGYHHEGIKSELRLVWQPYRQTQEAFGFRQHLRSQNVGLEAIRFLGDYHGFVPFAGAGVSHEWLRLSEKDGPLPEMSFRTVGWAPRLALGWDIRPVRAEWWWLRTNLSYAYLPEIRPGYNRHRLTFNFIQFVMYPERLAVRRKYRDEFLR